MSKTIVAIIIILSETSTQRTSWSQVALRLFLLIINDDNRKQILNYEIEDFEDEAISIFTNGNYKSLFD